MNRFYLQYKAVDVLAPLLPRRFCYWVGLRVADAFYRRDRRGRLAVKSNLRHILSHRGLAASDETLERLARRVFQHFGKYLVDFFTASRISRRQVERLVSVEHAERLDEARASGMGTIVVTAHLGNWEIGGTVLKTLGCPLSAVVLPESDRRIRALFRARREERLARVISLGDAARELLVALRERRFVGLLVDRDYSGRLHLVEFFGAPARLPNGPAVLSRRTGCPILPGFLLRQPDDTYLLRLHPLLWPRDFAGVDEMQGRIARILETEIGERPEQWFMFRDFWDTASPLPRP
jgi:KDO2-lipid IV(A) lauroyltransferase